MMFSKSVANSSSVFRMSRASYLVFFLVSHLLLGSLAQKEKSSSPKCQPFQCGRLGLVSFPFFNETYPECGFLRIDNCNGQVPSIHLGKDWPKLNVDSISQDNTVRLHNPSGLPNSSGPPEFDKPLGGNRSCDEFFKNLTLPSSSLIFFKINQSLFNCPHGKNLKNFGFLVPCNHSKQYIVYNNGLSKLPSNCSPIPFGMKRTQKGVAFFNLFTQYLELQVTEECLQCRNRGGKCQAYKEKFRCSIGKDREDGKLGLKLGLGLAVSAILIVLVISCSRNSSQHNAMVFWKNTMDFQNIEAFLRNHGSLAPKRYGYSDIKKMTNSFKHKLGQGGYGAVYKGKLPDGCCVAVKVLTESKGNGEEFINEVASITRTSHVNIVTLLGFCFEGRKRALIYEFMCNGSLEKFIHEKSLLKWETMYQIVVGIARGLEYLHRGCNTRILHFDIKPHNILLDEDFCPKISDFGLAKICPKKECTISMTGARGTIGYIAPEVFSRNFGVVSHKSDVYSYGRMVLEMTGARHNNNVQVDNSSESYFPQLIYKRLEVDEELGLHGISNEDDEEIVKKMIIVSLWCIQINPLERPTMSKVVEMLEGSIHSLQIPPNPFLSSLRPTSRDSSISVLS